ncbi:MAG: hypothetical protein KDD45_05690 [Bdellovibrionales bacterium]|nr:hypothetical protein [Bdellovibrionales bacterium]
MLKSLIIFTLTALLSSSVWAKKIKEPSDGIVDLNAEALKEINQPISNKSKNQPLENQKNSDDSGILQIKTLRPLDLDSRLVIKPLGVSISYQKLSGQLINKKNSVLDLDQISSSSMFNINYSHQLDSQKYLTGYAISLGLQRSSERLQSGESVILNQNLLQFSLYRKLVTYSQINFFAHADIGGYRIQAVSSENGLLNTEAYSYYSGIGAGASHSISSHFTLVSELSFRNTLTENSSFNLAPLEASLGVSYLW